MIKNPNIKKIAEAASVNPAQLILAWLLGKGIIVIPKAESYEHLLENFQADKVKLSREIIKALDDFGSTF